MAISFLYLNYLKCPLLLLLQLNLYGTTILVTMETAFLAGKFLAVLHVTVLLDEG